MRCRSTFWRKAPEGCKRTVVARLRREAGLAARLASLEGRPSLARFARGSTARPLHSRHCLGLPAPVIAWGTCRRRRARVARRDRQRCRLGPASRQPPAARCEAGERLLDVGVGHFALPRHHPVARHQARNERAAARVTLCANFPRYHSWLTSAPPNRLVAHRHAAHGVAPSPRRTEVEHDADRVLPLGDRQEPARDLAPPLEQIRRVPENSPHGAQPVDELVHAALAVGSESPVASPRFQTCLNARQLDLDLAECGAQVRDPGSRTLRAPSRRERRDDCSSAGDEERSGRSVDGERQRSLLSDHFAFGSSSNQPASTSTPASKLS